MDDYDFEMLCDDFDSLDGLDDDQLDELSDREESYYDDYDRSVGYLTGAEYRAERRDEELYGVW